MYNWDADRQLRRHQLKGRENSQVMDDLNIRGPEQCAAGGLGLWGGGGGASDGGGRRHHHHDCGF